MADALMILDGSGPLPLSVDFNAEFEGSVVFVLTGTAWTTQAGTMIGISLLLDGELLGNAACYANLINNHQTMRTTLIPFDNMTVGKHTIEVKTWSALPNTVTDFNDIFQVKMLY